MNGLNCFLEARTIWDMPRGHRPQGVEHGHGHSLGALELTFQQKTCFVEVLFKQNL